MTPVQFARTECANWDEGRCKGIMLGDAGQITAVRALPRCLLINNHRCDYFEQCVMPMTKDKCNAANTAWMKERDEAVRLYRTNSSSPVPLSAPTPPPPKRLCPSCHQRPLEPFKRLCYVCRDNLKRSKAAERQRRARSTTTLPPDVTQS